MATYLAFCQPKLLIGVLTRKREREASSWPAIGSRMSLHLFKKRSVNRSRDQHVTDAER